MEAGKLAITTGATADEPLSPVDEKFRALSVEETYTYLDGSEVQTGKAVDTVDSREQHIEITHDDGGEVKIETETEKVGERVVTDWIGDLVDAGFACAASTAGTNAEFPFGMIRAEAGVPMAPACINTAAFADAQEDMDVWMVGSKQTNAEGLEHETAEINYHGDGLHERAARANVGIGFRTAWNGTMVRGVMYSSGYIALYDQTVTPVQFAAFVRDEVLPHTFLPDPESEPHEQATL